MEDIILVGYGGHARSVADCIERAGIYSIIGYTDTVCYETNYTYLGTDEVLEQYRGKGIKNAFVAIGYMGKGNLREKLYNKLKKLDFILPSVVDPSAIISASAEINEGSFIGKGAIINAEARIGKMCMINTRALIEHECCIDDFSHIAVGAVLCGQVFIGCNSFIGANATIIQNIKLPECTFVPAGKVIR